MPQPVTKRRSGTSILAAGALVASLVAVGAGPAGAVETVADHATPVTACVGDATEDWMFDDVSAGHFFRGAINCLAYYGVTDRLRRRHLPAQPGHFPVRDGAVHGTIGPHRRGKPRRRPAGLRRRRGPTP